MKDQQKKKINLGNLRHLNEQRFDIRIATDGRWFHEGGEIFRIELVKLFASILHRGKDGEYWLATPAEKGRITVDDEAIRPLQLFCNEKTKDLRPYIEVRDGLFARLSRPVYYELAEHAKEGPNGKLGVWSHNRFFDMEP